MLQSTTSRVEAPLTALLGQGDITPAQVDHAIATLMAFRASLAPNDDARPPFGQRRIGVPSPLWGCERESSGRGSLMHVRHPGLGWLTYFFPKKHAALLGSGLLQQAMQTVPGQPDIRN